MSERRLSAIYVRYQSADYVPFAVVVVQVPHQAVGVLAQAFLPDEIGAFQLGFIGKAVDGVPFAVACVGETEFAEFVVVTELFVVSVAVCVVGCGTCAEVVIDTPRSIQEMVVLPEIVGSALPQTAVVKAMAFCGAQGRVGPVLDEMFVQAVELSEAHAIHIAICLYAGIGVEAVVIVACRDSVPCLTCVLVIAKVLVAYF